MKIDLAKPTTDSSLVAKPLSGIEPEKPQPKAIPSLMPDRPAPSPKVELMPKAAEPKVEDDIASIVAAVKSQPESKITSPANPLLGSLDEAFNPMADLSAKIDSIESILTQKGIPVLELKRACDGIMKDLAANPDSVLELEPFQIKAIVQGYIKAADEGTQEVLKKKKKTTKKKIEVDPEIQKLLDLSSSNKADDSW